jgi:hypothetical protein
MSDSNESLKSAVENLIVNLAGKSKPDLSKAEGASILTDAFSRLQVKHNFKVGDLVQWKAGLRNLKPYGPFVIDEILPERLVYPVDSGPYSGEIYSAYALFIANDGDVMRLPIGLERLEPFTPDAED